jgi:hypothetical protein
MERDRYEGVRPLAIVAAVIGGLAAVHTSINHSVKSSANGKVSYRTGKSGFGVTRVDKKKSK